MPRKFASSSAPARTELASNSALLHSQAAQALPVDLFAWVTAHPMTMRSGAPGPADQLWQWRPMPCRLSIFPRCRRSVLAAAAARLTLLPVRAMSWVR
jgi:hypothetical protein